MYLELYESKQGWCVRIRGGNHHVMFISTVYAKKANAVRSLRQLAFTFGLAQPLEDVIGS